MGNKLKAVSFNKLIKVFEHYGWKIDRMTGSHYILVKNKMIRPLVIPR